MLKIETGKAKAAFSAIKKRARTQDVAVTRHGKVEVYLVSPERYDKFLAVAEAAPDSLKKLEDDYLKLFEKMQSPASVKAMRALKAAPLERILAEGAMRGRPRRPARKPVRARKTRAASRG